MVCSDAFSSLERSRGAGSHWNGAGFRPPQQAQQQQRFYEENRKLNQKVSQFKGVLRTTIDKLSEPVDPVDHLPVLPANARHRLFPASKPVSQQEQRDNLKKEFMEFSRSQNGKKWGGGSKGGGGGSRRNQSMSKQQQQNDASK